jgi:hypothetical protein
MEKKLKFEDSIEISKFKTNFFEIDQNFGSQKRISKSKMTN